MGNVLKRCSLMNRVMKDLFVSQLSCVTVCSRSVLSCTKSNFCLRLTWSGTAESAIQRKFFVHAPSDHITECKSQLNKSCGSCKNRLTRSTCFNEISKLKFIPAGYFARSSSRNWSRDRRGQSFPLQCSISVVSLLFFYFVLFWLWIPRSQPAAGFLNGHSGKCKQCIYRSNNNHLFCFFPIHWAFY